MRPFISWIVPGAVVAVGVFAGLDAIRSSRGAPASTEANATEAVTKTQTDTDAELASFPELQTRRVVRLMPGRVRTNERFPIAVTFKVPPGWYGSQDKTVFVLGMGIVGDEVDLVPGGMTVYVLDSELADAARRLEQVKGIRVESSVRLGGYIGRRYAVRRGDPRRDVRVSLRNALGVPGFLHPLDPDLILLGVGRKTLVIRPAFSSDQVRAELNSVLRSFRVTTPVQAAIEQTGNKWARLFGAGHRCNRFMGQPACQRIECERVGGIAIQNCTPLSPAVQRSFAGAVVQDIVIRGHWAAARFSNGKTVLLSGDVTRVDWSIAKIGAGRKFFE
jgi:hypothetical protein